jgi:hypothetical protein
MQHCGIGGGGFTAGLGGPPREALYARAVPVLV